MLLLHNILDTSSLADAKREAQRQAHKIQDHLNEITSKSQQILEWEEKFQAAEREKERLMNDKTVLESMLANVKNELNEELSSSLNARKQIVELESKFESSQRDLKRMQEVCETNDQKSDRIDQKEHRCRNSCQDPNKQHRIMANKRQIIKEEHDPVCQTIPSGCLNMSQFSSKV